MIHFHYCDSYKDEVPSNVDKTIRRKLNEYSYRDTLKGINSISSYTGRIVILNLVNPHYKVVLEEQRLHVKDEDLLIYFVRNVYGMGQKAQWLQDYVQIRDGKWLEYNPLAESEILDFISTYSTLTNYEEIKPFPPSHLTDWHNDYKLKVEYDIYETEAWVKFALSNSSQDGMKDDEAKLYRLTLLDIINNSFKGSQIQKLSGIENYETFYIESYDIAIIYSVFYCEIKTRLIYLLHTGGNIFTQKLHLNEASLKFQTHVSLNTLEDIQRVSIRAYPNWALNNADLWKAIQKNSETGNLSLLPEQTNFLKDFTFPKYINGQAGSGKSTMLYYLFSNAYYYKCCNEIKGDIIFLTENEELLKHTKRSIIELLQCNPEFEISAEDIANVDNHFTSFKRFLLNLIPENDSAKLFNKNKYLDFSTFKVEYEDSNLPLHIIRRYSAELVWFALTTYVFGFDLDIQITSANYEEMMPVEGKDLLRVDDLKGIEKDVLPFYRKLLESGYWDKISIIKYINDNIRIENQYEVVFCDEAQDFSRVELQFILSLSVYVNYDLSETTQVPIVFAGDALQTVNPTGFRSAEVKDMLYKELKEIGAFKLNTDNIEYAPGFNYRSSQPIVNVANAIQYYRKTHFQADVKKPQIAKRPDYGIDTHLNVFLDYETTNDELKRKLQYKVFIVPINSDEKDQYIIDNPFLADFTENIKTAVEAKGIDYEQVVLFGFGEYILKRNNIEEYENRFFYNKLYVAVTRAQFELIIIDSLEAEADFWKPLIQTYAESNWSIGSDVDRNTIKDTIVFGAGQISNIIQSTPELAFENAIKDKRQGIFDRNPHLLRVAANQFLRLGDKAEHYVCLAEMSRIKSDWEGAAKFYLKKEVGSNGTYQAANAFWEGKLLKEFLNISVNLRSEIIDIQKIISKLILNKEISFSDIKVLYNYRKEFRKLLNEISWRNEILFSLISLLNIASEEEVNLIIDIFDDIATENDSDVWVSIGERNIKLKKYESALSAFEKVGFEGLSFIKAHIELAKKSNNYGEWIIWLMRYSEEQKDEDVRVKIGQEIIEVFSKNRKAINIHGYLLSHLYAYFSSLIHNPYDPNIKDLAIEVEKEFIKLKRIDELWTYYEELLFSNRADPIVLDFVINRWVKTLNKSGNSIDEINNKYKKYCTHKKFDFIQFSQYDIDSISDFPSNVLAQLPQHFNNLKIKNFRKFDELVIENLSLVNLVVGDNNVGKTSFLEALLFTDNKAEYIERLAFSYIERRNIQPEKAEDSEGIKMYYSIDEKFLEDFIHYSSEEFNLEISIKESRNIWRYKVMGDFNIKNPESPEFFQPIVFAKEDFGILQNIDFFSGIKQPFMPYGKGFGLDLAKAYYNEIATKPKIEQEFILNMKTFIRSIDRINVNTLTGNIDVLDSDFPDEYRPLHQYGEGANKLFRILVMLALHKGKRVLIDEIDAGIHYTRFRSFWSGILQIAVRDKTQLVVTTHNEECIKYFSEILQELGESYQYLTRVVQLKNIANAIKVRSYDFANFNVALKEDLELRGGGNG
jgi:AAA15 family ATPase/GTPase